MTTSEKDSRIKFMDEDDSSTSSSEEDETNNAQKGKQTKQNLVNKPIFK